MAEPDDVDLMPDDRAQNLVNGTELVVPEHGPGQANDDRNYHYRQYQDRHGDPLAPEVADEEQCQTQPKQEFERDRTDHEQPRVGESIPDANIEKCVAVIRQPDERVFLALQIPALKAQHERREQRIDAETEDEQERGQHKDP